MVDFLNSYFIVLKDEYSDWDLHRTKIIMTELKEFVVIDERSDWNRSKVPLEEEYKRLEQMLLGKKEPEQIVPEKIEVKK